MNTKKKSLTLCCCHVKCGPSLLKLFETNLNKSFHKMPDEFDLKIHSLKDPELLEDLFWLLDNPRHLEMKFHGESIPMGSVFSKISDINVFVTTVYRYPKKSRKSFSASNERRKAHLSIV